MIRLDLKIGRKWSIGPFTHKGKKRDLNIDFLIAIRKSIFFVCEQKNLTNNRDSHRDPNRSKECDFSE